MREKRDPVEPIDQNKLYLMIRLARYEQSNRDHSLRINKCYRTDFIGYALLRNFLLTSIAYVLLLAVIAMLRLDVLLADFNNLNFTPIIALAIVGYLVLLGVYSVITYMVASLRYSRAESSIEQYDKQLERLDHMYREKARMRHRNRRQPGREKE